MRSVSEVQSYLIITLEKRQYPLNNDYCYHLHDLASKPMDVETMMSSQDQQTEVHLTMKRIPNDFLLDLHSFHSLKKILLQTWLYSCTSSVWPLSFETILESPSWTVQSELQSFPNLVHRGWNRSVKEIWVSLSKIQRMSLKEVLVFKSHAGTKMTFQDKI